MDLQGFNFTIVIPMVRLSNHFIEDLEKTAPIVKKEISETIVLETDSREFKTRYNTAQLIESDPPTRQREHKKT